MTKKLLVLLTMGIFSLSAVLGCDKKKEEEKTEKAEKAAEEEKAEEEKAEEEAVEEEEKAEEGTVEGDPCAQWEKCCKDYAEVLSKLEGVPGEAVEAMKKGCDQIEQLKATPQGAEACKMAMEGMRKTSEAYKAIEGFEMPASCQ